jgi:methylmalonyl-CoA mutase
MSSDLQDLSLAAEFPTATRDDWARLVEGVLKGAPIERLTSRTADGLRIEPIYQRAKDASVVPGRGAAQPWEITQRIDHLDAATANRQAISDLENGASGLELVFAGSASAHGFGLPATAAALEGVLTGIHLDAGIGITLSLPAGGADLPGQLGAILARRDLQPGAVDIRFSLDPIGDAARAGGAAATWKDSAAGFAATAREIAALGFKGPCALADGRIIHDAGGSEAQELAFVLASGVAYLRALTEAGLTIEAARRMIHAHLSADADQFMTLAKFRALRLLWAHVERNCGLAPERLFLSADTAWRMLTRRDPYVNLLRNTIAVFAAGLGGANSITVLPHTLALGLPDAFARRIARNTQLILLEESNLDKVTDPAAGSGGIEDLTAQLARTAWSLFQDIERAGGAFAALQSGLVQDKAGEVRAARATAVARRKNVLTGASEFPNLKEAPADVLAPAPASAPLPAQAVAFAALEPMRLAEPFEQLRDRSDAVLAATGARPRVFLANLGTHADFTARATFARSFFEAGGIEALDSEGGDAATIAQAFRDSGAALACLCSSDRIYAGQAVAAAEALRNAGAAHIYLAGRPGDLEAALRAAGVGGFIMAGDDAVATLTAAYEKLGL